MLQIRLFYDIIQDMKEKLAILPIIICLGIGGPVVASDCIGDTCDIDTTYWDDTDTLTLVTDEKLGDDSVLLIDTVSDQTCLPVSDDYCPFDTDTECEIWHKKPMMRENVSPRSPRIRDVKMHNFIGSVIYNGGIDATNPAARPLLARYQLLMRAARACCTDGLVYSLQRAGASDGTIYKFLVDDANFYNLGARCLMTTDDEIATQDFDTITPVMVSDVRNECLCQSREWFTAMLAPFQQAYTMMPEFADSEFLYTYTDGLQRTTTVSINQDVQNVLGQLAMCP